MPHSFNQAALAIIVNSMKGKSDARLAYLEKKITALERAVSVQLTYHSDQFDIIPEIEKSIVDSIDKANPAKPNVQIHIASAPVIIKADKGFTEFIFTAVFSQLFYSIQQGALITVHITKTDNAGIIEIQEATIVRSIDTSFNNAAISTDQPLIVCRQIMEDMGGEMICLQNNSSNYFRLKFLLG